MLVAVVPSRFFVCRDRRLPLWWAVIFLTGTETKGQANSHQPCKVVWSGLSPPTPCLPCVRGGAERMRSGGVVGTVQEKVICNHQLIPTRYPQPLSQTLRVCQLPLHRGAKPRGGRRFPAEGAKPCGGAACPSKKPPCLLDKAALRCYIGVSKSGARARCWSLPSIDLRSKGKPLPLRWRLFLYVPEDTKDNRCHEQ